MLRVARFLSAPLLLLAIALGVLALTMLLSVRSATVRPRTKA